MTYFTDLELNVLNQLIEFRDHFKSEHDDLLGQPYPHVDAFIYAKDIQGDQKQIRGALSSLLQKDAIEQLESEDEHGRFAWIFAISYNAWKQITGAA